MTQRLTLVVVALMCSPLSQAAILPYDISSPDDLSNIQVGQTVHFDIALTGISGQTWDDTAIFNARAFSSDVALWEAPFNVLFNPALSVISNTVSPGQVSWVHVDTPLTMLNDFVMSFDIVAAVAGAGSFQVNGADIFQVTGQDADFTQGAALDFNIVPVHVPEPGTLGLLGLGLLAISVARRRQRAYVRDGV